jgi:DNA (cytosine-5)-methyltransferase 1
MKRRYADLFCGLGAFHTAFDKLDGDYECVFACDIDEKVRRIYEMNHGIAPHGDINALDIEVMPDFDILCAGFPCQPFSIAGKKEGFEDKVKGNLFYRIMEIVDIKQPKTLILENVKNLHTIHNGETFKIIIHELEKRGYHVNYKVIDSRYYGSPQSRQRIYIVCDKDTKYKFRLVKKPITPVSTIIDHTVKDFFEYEEKYTLEPSKGRMKYILINKKTGKGGRQGERVYSIDDYGPTICASSGGPGSKTGLYEIGGKIRKLTIKEALQMSGFSPEYKYGPKDNMLFYIGNSIVVNVLEELLKDLPR